MRLRIPSAARRPLGPLAAALALTVTAGCAGFGGPAMSLQEERRLGQEARTEIERSLPISRDPAVVNYIRGVGERLVASSGLTQFDYTFDVVDDPRVNAFAVPGGHLYVNTGLVCAADNEDELAGVVGHEIAHAAERHGVSQMSAQQQAQAAALGGAALLSILLGSDPGQVSPAVAVPATLAAQGFLLKYSRDHERQADDLAVRYLHRAGYDPYAVAGFFEELKSREPGEPGRLGALLSSHPVTRDRIEATRQAASRLGPPPSRSGADRDQALERVQTHLQCERLERQGRPGAADGPGAGRGEGSGVLPPAPTGTIERTPRLE